MVTRRTGMTPPPVLQRVPAHPGLRAIPLIARIEDRSLLTGIVLAYSGFFWPILVNVLAPAIPKTAMFALSAAVGLATVIPVRKQRIG
ncbi:MAG: hypothetical protein OJI74_17760 [Rhodanobacter thiooxydans]|uniref:hypothetical protein n=1 Tax=Burkholderia sp. LMG 13014 TaxID=2709306 RepID=UPI00196351F1|nr:hypothetical protein [Burkholderia sp. LMG 13014]MCW0203717.1 hypothetical protein [Rhodanobacter thiooxydans]